ncbi:MAG TPA: hypothetical protein PLU87_16080 [Sedimentisphaerales bacterium]|nr:hypothetical protein [Sedimentisphaerales bacterium]HRS12585.1 hypothetical protein [Sedimentisphaerales bacterium]HRV49223.1 hypothetical protein [Sedimentisphaerales bacterium]
MKIDFAAVRKCLKAFDFNTLFREHLGWDNHHAQLDIPIDGNTIQLHAVAQKRGFVAFVCPSIPDRPTRLKLDHQVAKSAREHFIVYADKDSGQQVWQWVRREPGKPLASRDHRFDVSQSGDPLIQRLNQIAVSLDEEESLTVVDVAGRARAAFDVDKVTKKFYDRFKVEHAAFQKFIKGIKADVDLQWYTSVMLNRMMFVYFIQKKGFLDGDTDYLRNRLKMVQQVKGKDQFLSFYRYFLLRLFHEGLGKSPDERQLDPVLEELLGEVPFLNGGFFEVHQIEERNPDIDIPDKAFEKLFDFFDEYSWHLDERPLRADKEINPDVVGYIYEKYINQKQMGAYYTKEDITEYISKNTIIPFLFDAARKKCAVAFEPDSALWRLLRDDPDRYIYPAVRHGVVRNDGTIVAESDLPDCVQKGMHNPKARTHDNRYNLQQAPADDPIRLVTETWREYVYRRNRCLEIREKLRKGEVHEINDLITLNLDIWQFARDAIVNAEGPELLRAFWHTIAGRVPEKSNEKFEQGITVLDPTCGSGAFLFAALRILETLYSDCLERMERFVEDLAGKPHHPEQYSDFKKVLAQIAKHPSDRYFILKSIIINNLFGVDIMEEAVEICKLRLFLKLVAQVETVDQIEPLPDIDFNIRAGNTLVGFASLEQVRKSQEGTFGFGKDQIKRIEEDAEVVENCFRMFRHSQVNPKGRPERTAKRELLARLAKLDDELDRYLAGEYAIASDKYRGKTAYEEAFAEWKASHQPFHWFVEFYGIMQAGGFDVIIGNPPYVEYSKVKQTYTIQGYSTESCGNLYAFVWERCLAIVRNAGAVGMIQPVAAVCTAGYEPLQTLFRRTGSSVVSNFNDRPSKLFDGLEHIRLCIVLQRKGMPLSTFSTTYNKWQSIERPHLFQNLAFIDTSPLGLGSAMAKVGTPIEAAILKKLQDENGLLTEYECEGKWQIYYTRKLSHFVQILDFIPAINDAKGCKREPSELKTVSFATQDHRDVFLGILNSSLFYWFLTVYSDCRNLNRRDIGLVRFDFARTTESRLRQLRELSRSLMADIRANSKTLTVKYKNVGEMRIQCTYPRYSKETIDEIDRVLAKHYGFTDEELDFIINYDIKYRMGQDNEDEED